MRLRIGEVVVYGTHGVGRVSARDDDIVVVELEDGLTVTLPLERAREQLRALADEAQLRDVERTLREERTLSVDPWLTRRRELQAKLSTGDLVQLAEVVGEGAQRERARVAKGNKPQLSPGEREMFVRARKLLSGEIARARGIQPSAAEGWIDEQLERPA